MLFFVAVKRYNNHVQFVGYYTLWSLARWFWTIRSLYDGKVLVRRITRQRKGVLVSIG